MQYRRDACRGEAQRAQARGTASSFRRIFRAALVICGRELTFAMPRARRRNPGRVRADGFGDRGRRSSGSRSGLAHEGEGKFGPALDLFRRAAQVKKTPQIVYHVGFCESRTGALVEALVDLLTQREGLSCAGRARGRRAGGRAGGATPTCEGAGPDACGSPRRLLREPDPASSSTAARSPSRCCAPRCRSIRASTRSRSTSRRGRPRRGRRRARRAGRESLDVYTPDVDRAAPLRLRAANRRLSTTPVHPWPRPRRLRLPPPTASSSTRRKWSPRRGGGGSPRGGREPLRGRAGEGGISRHGVPLAYRLRSVRSQRPVQHRHDPELGTGSRLGAVGIAAVRARRSRRSSSCMARRPPRRPRSRRLPAGAHPDDDRSRPSS